MRFGYITPQMWTAMQYHTKGKKVWDLGCGRGNYDIFLADEAHEYVLIDKVSYGHNRVARFEDIEKEVQPDDVVLLAWPSNSGRNEALRRILETACVVIYIGCNSDAMTAAGHYSYLLPLQQREILSFVEHPRNTLLVYGREPRAANEPYGAEEEAIKLLSRDR